MLVPSTQADCGSVGVFDPQSNALIKIIQARKSVVAPYSMSSIGLNSSTLPDIVL